MTARLALEAESQGLETNPRSPKGVVPERTLGQLGLESFEVVSRICSDSSDVVTPGSDLSSADLGPACACIKRRQGSSGICGAVLRGPVAHIDQKVGDPGRRGNARWRLVDADCGARWGTRRVADVLAIRRRAGAAPPIAAVACGAPLPGCGAGPRALAHGPSAVPLIHYSGSRSRGGSARIRSLPRAPLGRRVKSALHHDLGAALDRRPVDRVRQTPGTCGHRGWGGRN